MRLSQINHRSAMEHLKNCSRTAHGRSTVLVRSRDACRAGASVFVGCSFCVRSRPVWRSSCVGSCGVRARRLTGGSQRRRIVEVKHKAVDATRAGHGRDTDCARTGDGRASVRLGRIQPSQDGRRRAVGGLATDGNGHATGYTRTIPLRTDNGRQTDRQWTSDGRRTGGHSSVADILRHSEMGGGMADLEQLGRDPEKNCNFAHLPIDLSNSIIQVIHKISSAP